MSARHASSAAGAPAGADDAATARAASDGQIVAVAGRAASSLRTASSSALSTGRTPDRRQASEQYRTWAQSRAHFLRQVIVRPQTAHGLVGGAGLIAGPKR